MGADVVWVLIPITALLIPIVAMLTRHQQKMAEILNRSSGDHSELLAIRQDLAELKTILHSHAINLDTYAGTQKSLREPPPSPTLSDRLSSY